MLTEIVLHAPLVVARTANVSNKEEQVVMLPSIVAGLAVLFKTPARAALLSLTAPHVKRLAVIFAPWVMERASALLAARAMAIRRQGLPSVPAVIFPLAPA